MNLILKFIYLYIIISRTVLSENVCDSGRCHCSKNYNIVNCDSKHLINLTNLDFPFNVVTLTFVNNQLKFETDDDRNKIENLTNLQTLSLNKNPLTNVPSFNKLKFQTLSLQDTYLRSAKFPLSYNNVSIQRISLNNNNNIRLINVDDFENLKNSEVKTLHIDSSSISTIDQNAFSFLNTLQSLSLKNNLLKSATFLSSIRSLTSIELDGNQFTLLPQELATPKTLRIYSFTNNSISIIDESSPLHAWIKINDTNLKLNLTNNPFDCCQSLWFIRFLRNSSFRFISDAALLQCAKPNNYAGQFLIKLNPDRMNCGGISPNKSWWTIGRIIGVFSGIFSIVILTIISVSLFFIHRKRFRSGYVEIDGSNNPSPSAPPLPSSDHSFHPYDNEDDDVMSSISTTSAVHSSASQAPNYSTIDGFSRVGDN